MQDMKLFTYLLCDLLWAIRREVFLWRRGYIMMEDR